MQSSERGSTPGFNMDRFHGLLAEALETEMGGVRIYETAIRCAVKAELEEEWNKYLDETRNHERLLRGVFEAMGIDFSYDTVGRRVVKAQGEALVNAMETALNEGDAEAAQVIAAECVVLAETKDHANWQLIGQLVRAYDGPGADELQAAHNEVEDQEDEHLYHTRGWARELWLEGLGLDAKFPPPEETRNVRTETEAAQAYKSRKNATNPTRGRSKSTRSAAKRKKAPSRSSRGGGRKTRRAPARRNR